MLMPRRLPQLLADEELTRRVVEVYHGDGLLLQLAYGGGSCKPTKVLAADVVRIALVGLHQREPQPLHRLGGAGDTLCSADTGGVLELHVLHRTVDKSNVVRFFWQVCEKVIPLSLRGR